MRLVILESPFAGSGRWPLNRIRQWRNVRYARACVRDAVLRGDSPAASHLLFTQPGILRDGVAEERSLGIAAGLAWGSAAVATVVYVDLGVSRGMVFGVEAANRAGRSVETRSLGPFAWLPGRWRAGARWAFRLRLGSWGGWSRISHQRSKFRDGGWLGTSPVRRSLVRWSRPR